MVFKMERVKEIEDGFLYAPLVDAEGNMKVAKYQVSLPAFLT
jgi:hypothetical protein